MKQYTEISITAHARGLCSLVYLLLVTVVKGNHLNVYDGRWKKVNYF